MTYKDPAKDRARRRNRENIRRATVSDITAEQEAAMRLRTRKCPLCSVYMTCKPNLPNSKELDHILPINQGGTHTHGNVRIICRQCNQKRPKDGRDYQGTLSLWAEDAVAVARRDPKTCRKGLHPWVPENIVNWNGKKRCRACCRAKDGTLLRQCRCGAMFPAPGRTLMCPDCTLAAARKAAYLHSADGLTWDEIAVKVGYGSAWGASYAAKRAGYLPAPRQARPRPRAGAARQGW